MKNLLKPMHLVWISACKNVFFHHLLCSCKLGLHKHSSGQKYHTIWHKNKHWVVGWCCRTVVLHRMCDSFPFFEHKTNPKAENQQTQTKAETKDSIYQRPKPKQRHLRGSKVTVKRITNICRLLDRILWSCFNYPYKIRVIKFLIIYLKK